MPDAITEEYRRLMRASVEALKGAIEAHQRGDVAEYDRLLKQAAEMRTHAAQLMTERRKKPGNPPDKSTH